jgi:hypothetical protein
MRFLLRFNVSPIKASRCSNEIPSILHCTSSASTATFGRRASGAATRALAIEGEDGFQWFWIGAHADYEDLIK